MQPCCGPCEAAGDWPVSLNSAASSLAIQLAINPSPFALSEWLKDSMAHLGDAPKKVKSSLRHQILDLTAPWDMQSVCLTTPKIQNRSCKLDLLAHAGKCKQNGALQRWESVL
eukprot:s968_g31.t1